MEKPALSHRWTLFVLKQLGKGQLNKQDTKRLHSVNLFKLQSTVTCSEVNTASQSVSRSVGRSVLCQIHTSVRYGISWDFKLDW